MKTYRWIVLIVLALSLGLPALPASAAPLMAPSASIRLTSPTPNAILIGDETAFDMVISVADIPAGVAGVEIYLKYDPALVEPPKTPGVSVAEVLPDFFGVSNVSINEVLPAGQCPGSASPCVHLVLAGPAQITQNGVAARFHFRGKAEGSACFSVLQSIMVDANGFQVEHGKASDQCMTVYVNATATGVVLRQGTPANPNPGGGSLACSTVTVTGTGAYDPVLTDKTGNFTIAKLRTGTYIFRAIYSGYLASEKTGVIVAGNSQTVSVGTTTLRGGDVNGDNAINILDVGVIISKFGKTGVAVKSASTSCGPDEPADINDDSLINISDLAIAAGNWGATGPTRWP